MTTQPDVVEVHTAHGPARVHLRPAVEQRGLLMLGHGAGGGVEAPDLRTTTDVALAAGWSVALVEQPYRVAGRRAPAPARQLDAAWTDVALHLLAGPFAGLPLILGGRSSGGRVACRTAQPLGARGVLCLAFPLKTPGRPDRPSRLPELAAARVPTLVVQGERDRFGVPPPAVDRTVVVVPGDHSLKKDQTPITEAVRTWLAGLTSSS